MKNRIVVVTPLKDEIENLQSLIDAIDNQSVSIYAWIIVQNGSTDGSKEFLDRMPKPINVEHFYIVDFTLPVEVYELGFKYSTVVSAGFSYIEKKIGDGVLSNITHYGICDADCFLPQNYYEDLLKFMDKNSLSISSGIGRFLNGEPDGEAKEWVRGNCRLWTAESFNVAGYHIGPSADALSLAKAEIAGFKAKPNLQLEYNCREMGKKSRYEYYGYSSYYRGVTLGYCLLKGLNYIRIGQAMNGYKFVFGYIDSFLKNKAKIDDQEIIDYFDGLLFRKIKSLFRKVD